VCPSQLSAAKEALARLRQEHKEAEAALRKNKKRAAQVAGEGVCVDQKHGMYLITAGWLVEPVS
jgi:hypothetical protein